MLLLLLLLLLRRRWPARCGLSGGCYSLAARR
jgi:hypothetical protein